MAATWEDLVHVDTVQPSDSGLIALFEWVDGSRTWVSTEMARKKFPQALIRYYETALIFDRK